MTPSLGVDHRAALEAIGRAEWLLAEAARLLVEPTLAAAIVEIDAEGAAYQAVNASRFEVKKLRDAYIRHKRSIVA